MKRLFVILLLLSSYAFAGVNNPTDVDGIISDIGDLTNDVGSLVLNAITNNQTNVTLQGTFSGDGSGLTGISAGLDTNMPLFMAYLSSNQLFETHDADFLVSLQHTISDHLGGFDTNTSRYTVKELGKYVMFAGFHISMGGVGSTPRNVTPKIWRNTNPGTNIILDLSDMTRGLADPSGTRLYIPTATNEEIWATFKMQGGGAEYGNVNGDSLGSRTFFGLVKIQ